MLLAVRSRRQAISRGKQHAALPAARRGPRCGLTSNVAQTGTENLRRPDLTFVGCPGEAAKPLAKASFTFFVVDPPTDPLVAPCSALVACSR